MLLAGCGLVGGEPDAIPPTPGSSSAATSAAPSTPGSSDQSSAAASPSSTDPTAGLERYYTQDVEWKNCGQADCATIKAPLNYADPEGPSIDLAITRVPATGERVGSLFVNPGGPGGSAVDYAKAADYIVSDVVRKHFDIVGVDPRGVAHSDPVHCMSDAQIDEFMAADGTPDSPVEEQEIVVDSELPATGCERNGGALIKYMGTVESARDLDIARAVVGDDALNYLGKSYGTMLGATYAELFPTRVGRLVLDGVLPPDLDMEQVTKGQADAFEVAVRDFVSYCLGSSGCPLTGSVDEGLDQLRSWLTSLDANPLKGGDRDLNEALATYATLSYLYFPGSDYPRLKDALRSGMQDQDPRPLLTLLDARISRGPDGHYYDNSSDAFYAVSCLDRPWDGTVDDVKALAEQWKATAPTFGPALAWGMLPCKDWPATSTPITHATANGSNPILVVSTKNDPATPYQWGAQLADELDNARLLTYDGYGHTAYSQGSSCIDEAVDAYLLKGTMPKDGLVCS